MKNLTLKIFFVILIVCSSLVFANAQTSEKYTYRDLLSQQKVERDELKQTHKETLDKILLRQKEEMETVNGNTGPTQTMQGSHQAEREKIVQLQKEEREKQMQIQADERKNFKPL